MAEFTLDQYQVFIRVILLEIEQGTYSNVSKACDLNTGKVVSLKKVWFDSFGA